MDSKKRMYVRKKGMWAASESLEEARRSCSRHSSREVCVNSAHLRKGFTKRNKEKSSLFLYQRDSQVRHMVGPLSSVLRHKILFIQALCAWVRWLSPCLPWSLLLRLECDPQTTCRGWLKLTDWILPEFWVSYYRPCEWQLHFIVGYSYHLGVQDFGGWFSQALWSAVTATGAEGSAPKPSHFSKYMMGQSRSPDEGFTVEMIKKALTFSSAWLNFRYVSSDHRPCAPILRAFILSLLLWDVYAR